MKILLKDSFHSKITKISSLFKKVKENAKIWKENGIEFKDIESLKKEEE